MNMQAANREFGKRSGFKVAPVSIGAMRLPDEEQAIALIRQAIDAGMVYIDTSRGYEGSERKLAKALKDGYREKVILSTKWASWIKKYDPADDTSADCTYKRIIESMQRLDVEYLDFYQIWNIHTPEQFEQVIAKGGMLDGIRRAMDEGLVCHTGFTTHDTPEHISDYIDRADWCEAILFTHNLLNPTYKDVLQKAHEKGIATIVMNPAGGGMLTEQSPVIQQAVETIADTDDVTEIAHRYLHSNPNIDTILCGISKPSDIESTLANYQKPQFNSEQVAQLEKAMAKLSSKNLGFCTGCKYCMPCPQGINIPVMMSICYYRKLLQLPQKAQNTYNWALNPNNSDISKPSSACIQCGACEKKCTQKLKIIDEMKYIAEQYESSV